MKCALVDGNAYGSRQDARYKTYFLRSGLPCQARHHPLRQLPHHPLSDAPPNLSSDTGCGRGGHRRNSMRGPIDCYPV